MALYNDSKYLDLIPITFWELSQLESVVHFFLEEALLTEALYEKMINILDLFNEATITH
jgi:hypothetical protein